MLYLDGAPAEVEEVNKIYSKPLSYDVYVDDSGELMECCCLGCDVSTYEAIVLDLAYLVGWL